MRLYLVRHGVAVNRADPAAPPDAERPLTKEGIAKTRAAAAGLRALGLKPDVALTSPLLRAAQTAEIVCAVLGFPLEKVARSDGLVPNALPEVLWKELTRLRAKEVVCFGHAPNLDLVIAHALGARSPVTELKKAGAACLDVETFSAPRSRLVWLLSPKILRLLAH